MSDSDMRVRIVDAGETTADRKGWLIISGEYPPQRGGVADYSSLIARELSWAGDVVRVVAPRTVGMIQDARIGDVEVHRVAGRFGWRALIELERRLRQGEKPTLLVQYVPHAYGYKAMNVLFCLWLWLHRKQDVRVMFHEVAYPMLPGQRRTHRALALVTRAMARIVASASTVIYVAIPEWERALRECGVPGNTRIIVLPVPSCLASDAQLAAEPLRHLRRVGSEVRRIVGHFGTYGEGIINLLVPVISLLVEVEPGITMVLLGRNAERVSMQLKAQGVSEERVRCVGALAPDPMREAILACDIMCQPYPDGVSARRTSTMAALALGIPVVTTAGALTDTLWGDEKAVCLAPVADADAMLGAIVALLADDTARLELGARGSELYERQFAVKHTIARLRGETA